jgi:hypothetical protein
MNVTFDTYCSRTPPCGPSSKSTDYTGSASSKSLDNSRDAILNPDDSAVEAGKAGRGRAFMSTGLLVARAEIAKFVTTLFLHADENTYISVRAFDQTDRAKPPFLMQSVKINGDPDGIITVAVRAAQRCADNARPGVFAPPVATFAIPRRARGEDVANGVAISVDLDEVDPDFALRRLEGLLGPVTLAVASGSDWVNPETGETKPKLHLHWRLSEPTRDAEDHDKLRQARVLSALLVGGDPTGSPVCHPMRWPGSWNLKSKPRMARIVTCNENAEIHLIDALDKLSEAVEQVGFDKADLLRSGPPQAALDLLQSATQAIPNADVHYYDWIRMGYACFRASGGSDDGCALWETWSKKSAKFNATEQHAAWKRIGKAISGSRARHIVGAGTIFFLAARHGWQRRQFETQPPEPEPAQRDPVDKLIAEFNQRYAVVNDAGKAVVFEQPYDPLLHRNLIMRISFQDFRRLYMNRNLQVGRHGEGRPILKPAAEVWLRHPARSQFIGGVTFDPSGKHVPDDVLNLWRGFAVEPKPGSWSRMQDHLLTIVCGGHTDLFTYLLDWSARLVQLPAERAEVAIVLKGGEGVGKGIFARALWHIFGQHGLAIGNPKHLIGNFNAHLRDCVFLFADEAFFAGDKAHVGVLKNLITEPQITIEGKNQNAVQAPNFLHLILASNEEWVVPAAIDSRRFLVLLVSMARAGDFPYFTAIQEELENGGYEAMLYELLHRDITDFNQRKVPVTGGLIEQRKLSLGTSEAWWYDVLHRGYVFASKLGLESYFAQWHDEVTTEVLFASYIAFAEGRRERRPMSRETFGKFMVEKARACARRLSNAPIGEHIGEVENPFGGVSRSAQLVMKPRPTGYHFGGLAQAREAFETATKLPCVWPEDEMNKDTQGDSESGFGQPPGSGNA